MLILLFIYKIFLLHSWRRIETSKIPIFTSHGVDVSVEKFVNLSNSFLNKHGNQHPIFSKNISVLSNEFWIVTPDILQNMISSFISVFKVIFSIDFCRFIWWLSLDFGSSHQNFWIYLLCRCSGKKNCHGTDTKVFINI